jgi:hypothetical protein
MAASPTLVIFATALATALATGAGALPFAFGRARMQRWLGCATHATHNLSGSSPASPRIRSESGDDG